MSESLDLTTIWLVMIAIGVGTFAMRLSFIALAGRLPMPSGLSRGLRFVPGAVLAALVAPAIVKWDPGTGLGLDDLPRVVAGLVAATVAWTTRGVFATLVAGMGTLWLLSALI